MCLHIWTVLVNVYPLGFTLHVIYQILSLRTSLLPSGPGTSVCAAGDGTSQSMGKHPTTLLDIAKALGTHRGSGATGTVRLQAIRMLTLEPERLKNQLATTRKDHRRWRALPPRRSSGLRFQFVSVEVFSLLP